MPKNCLPSYRTTVAWDVLSGCDSPWDFADAAALDRLWSGEISDSLEARTRVLSLWDPTALYLHFRSLYRELHTANHWKRGGPVDRLWEYDVVEAFLRPISGQGYFEFEVSPLGQWLDVFIEKPREKVDFGWSSGLETAVRVLPESGEWKSTLRVPYAAMSRRLGADCRPEVGSIWRANFFRIARPSPSRHYLCWQPTFTETPDFHRPEAFGNLLFLESPRGQNS